MASEKTCRIFISNELGEERMVEYVPYEYNNLMELVYNELWEDWGDCKGRAMCGTCHVEVISGIAGEADEFEQHTLEGLPNITDRSRLACQLTMTAKLDNMKFRILKDF